jgi:hypothetical protein
VRTERNGHEKTHKFSLERMSQELSKDYKLQVQNIKNNNSTVNQTDNKLSKIGSTSYKAGFLNKNATILNDKNIKEVKNPLTKPTKGNFLFPETSTGFYKGSETARKIQEPLDKSNNTPDKAVVKKGVMKIKNFYEVVKKENQTSGANSARTQSSKPEIFFNVNSKKTSKAKV